MGRLDNLENSLISLINDSGSAESQSTATSPGKPKVEPSSGMVTTPHTPASSESGSMHYSSMGTVYVSSAHWMSILDNISEMRDCLGHEEGCDESLKHHDQPHHPPELYTEPLSTEAPHLLSGLSRIPTKAEVLSAMPDRSVADRHVFWYFNRLPLGAAVSQ